MLHQMALIPSYESGDWTSEEVAKGLQAYLICIEMFIAAILHIFVFPHSDYLKPLSIGSPRSGVNHIKGRQVGRKNNTKRLHGGFKDDRSYGSKTSDAPSPLTDVERGAHHLATQQRKVNDSNDNIVTLADNTDQSKERTG